MQPSVRRQSVDGIGACLLRRNAEHHAKPAEDKAVM